MLVVMFEGAGVAVHVCMFVCQAVDTFAGVGVSVHGRVCLLVVRPAGVGCVSVCVCGYVCQLVVRPDCGR